MNSNNDFASRGLEYLEEATLAVNAVADAIESDGRTDEAHSQLRAALNTLRSAMNWLEDTPDFDTAHSKLDQVGAFARNYFPDGCALRSRMEPISQSAL